ncbi:TPA: hypothetical protein ACH3X1_006351 [Trebouxia sp. C0004]
MRTLGGRVDAETSMAGQREGLNVILRLVVRHLSGSGQHLQQLLCMPLPGQCDTDGIAPNQSREEEEFQHMHAWLMMNVLIKCASCMIRHTFFGAIKITVRPKVNL